MKLLTLKANYDSNDGVLAKPRPVLVNPNRICTVRPDGRTGGSLIDMQDGNTTGVTAPYEEIERRFEEITSPAKSKILRILARHIRVTELGSVELRVNQSTDPEDHKALMRFIEENAR